MLYDLSNPLQNESFGVRAEALRKKGNGIVELTEKKPQRTAKQNNYLHSILAYFGLEVGETAEYVKRYYFKILCNKDLFVVEKEDKYHGKIKVVRSSAELDTAEMTTAIERFRNWAAGEGVYIPSADEHLMVQQMEIEISRNKMYL
jgi:hypothetical protein